MAKNWHKKHIPTKWGIAILGVLLGSMILLIPILGENQILQSDAAYIPEGYYKCGAGRTGIKYCKKLTCAQAGGTCGRSCGRNKKINNTFTCSAKLNCCLPK